ncbi:uncharacterized protein LOC119989139 isoform X2 [Tripterygium wilfordii]|uniref:uncharacterized protein LOC119989139 isoform X2 n=1 Tax=Tripterygium wilfordii TaxID=458696 RepID=UPI0018F851E6|nr:uncharacterized protein LOC119989139 isoform X2 [Tripterygium wilfordii]
MADNPKLEISDSCDSYGSENKIGTQKISVLDHVNGFQYESTDKSDSFVIDMESFCHGTKKDCTPNSRITRNLSRKGSMPMRSSDKKINTNFNTNKCSNDRDTITTIAALSPKGSSMPERPATAVTVGSTDHSNKQLHNQITITTTTENRFPLRRNSFKRATPSWILDPKRVLLMFATLSSMGTILLIYFTLSISKISTDENVDWLQ